MLPPSRGRVIFCETRDKDGTRGVIHRRNVVTPPTQSPSADPRGGALPATAVNTMPLPQGDFPADVPHKGSLRNKDDFSSQDNLRTQMSLHHNQNDIPFRTNPTSSNDISIGSRNLQNKHHDGRRPRSGPTDELSDKGRSPFGSKGFQSGPLSPTKEEGTHSIEELVDGGIIRKKESSDEYLQRQESERWIGKNREKTMLRTIETPGTPNTIPSATPLGGAASSIGSTGGWPNHDRSEDLSPVYNHRHTPAASSVPARYGGNGDESHNIRYQLNGLLSPSYALSQLSPAVTPMGGLPLSPEHEVFRHLSESPSSNSRQGRRRSQLDLRCWKQGEILGQGSSAEVYKAMCQGQFLAVKKIRLKMGSNASTKREADNLKAEIELLKRLDHPRIVRYAGCLLEEGECGMDLLIFIEYMPSGSLSSVLKKFGAYGLPLAKKYTRQVLEGLAFLHSKGIVHRDVKGANVLVDHLGEAKLADFGACKELDALASTMSGNLTGEVKGSVFWMAPEMVLGTAGRRSDIWSTGCVVIEMLTAQTPWALQRKAGNWTLPQALQHIVESDEIPPFPNNVEPVCNDFLLLLLVRDHRKRPYAHKCLQHDFLRRTEPSSKDKVTNN